MRRVCCLGLFFAKSTFVCRAGGFCQTCFRDWRSSRCVSDCRKSGTQLCVSCHCLCQGLPPPNHQICSVGRESTMGRQWTTNFLSGSQVCESIMYSSCRCALPSGVQGPGALSIQLEPRIHPRPLDIKEGRHRVCFEKETILGFEMLRKQCFPPYLLFTVCFECFEKSVVTASEFFPRISLGLGLAGSCSKARSIFFL